MISSEPVDGTCYKMTVEYYADGNMEEIKYHRMWGEDELELMRYYEAAEHIWPYVHRIEIVDDSK